MNVLLKTLSGYQRCYLRQDLLSGVVIAAVSIPISMATPRSAGLPAAYGLYGSVLPVLLFALFSTSSPVYFWRGRRASGHGGQYGGRTGHPLRLGGCPCMVPLLAFYTGVWLLLFALLKAGKCSISSQPPSWAVYQRHLLHHHPHAGAQAHGARRRDGGTIGAGGAHPRRRSVRPLAVPGAGGGCTGNFAAGETFFAQVPHGHPHHGGRCRRLRLV